MMAAASPSAEALHRDALVIDGLIALSDGYADGLLAGGVDAVNLTVAGYQADFAECCDDMAEWIERASRPEGSWRIVLAADDILAARREGKVGLVMGFQNMRPVEDKLHRLALFHRAGVRIMQLTYNERNFLGDGCLEPEDGGLSLFGKRAVAEMNRLGIAVDLSHVGERTLREAALASSVPVLMTHANARKISPAPRNKSDDAIKAVAATGGVIGVSIHGALCWRGDPKRPPTLADAVANLEHMVGLVGIDHVSIGTDFVSVGPAGRARLERVLEFTASRYPSFISGFVEAFGNGPEARYPKDCASPAQLPALTAALLARGWKEADARAVLGENLFRVLKTVWRD